MCQVLLIYLGYNHDEDCITESFLPNSLSYGYAVVNGTVMYPRSPGRLTEASPKAAVVDTRTK